MFIKDVKFKKTVKFYWKKGLKGCYRFIKCSLRKLGKKILSRKCVIIRRSCSIKKRRHCYWMDRKFGCRIRNCCTSFYKGNRKIRHNCYLSNRTCPIKKTKRCRVIKRGRCHRNVCCHSKRKNGRLLKKKMLQCFKINVSHEKIC